jgi:hypothetical protein
MPKETIGTLVETRTNEEAGNDEDEEAGDDIPGYEVTDAVANEGVFLSRSVRNDPASQAATNFDGQGS